jgi:diguanylate cyclase (GGDEF)-like protein
LPEHAALRMTIGAAIVAIYAALTAAELSSERRRKLQKRWPAVAVPVLHGFVLMLPILLGDFLRVQDENFTTSIWVTAFAIELVLYAVGTVFIIFMLVSERTVSVHRTAATIDPLTGMFNRRGFAEATSRMIEREANAGRPVTVMIFDIDHFKSINDRFGHPAGDEVLKLFAAVVTNTLRMTDLSGRVGGEEFAALLPCSIDEALIAAERVREAFAASGIAVDDAPVSASAWPAGRRSPSWTCCWRPPTPRSTRPNAAAAIASRQRPSNRCRWKADGAESRALPATATPWPAPCRRNRLFTIPSINSKAWKGRAATAPTPHSSRWRRPQHPRAAALPACSRPRTNMKPLLSRSGARRAATTGRAPIGR